MIESYYNLQKNLQSYWDQTTTRPPAEHFTHNRQNLIAPTGANQFTPNLPLVFLSKNYTEEHITFIVFGCAVAKYGPVPKFLTWVLSFLSVVMISKANS